MTVSINKIHSNNRILPSTDDMYYIYKYTATTEEYNWCRDDGNYYKYYDVENYDDVLTAPGYPSLNENDRVLFYSSKKNKILYSENYEETTAWKKTRLKKVKNNINFKFPEAAGLALKYNTNDSYTSVIDHCIEQKVIVKSGYVNLFSTYLRPVDGDVVSKVSIGFFIYEQNTGVVAKIDLKDLTGFDSNGYKEITSPSLQYVHTDYTPSSPENIIEAKAYIQKIDMLPNPYFRVSLAISTRYMCNGTFKINVLNANGDFKFASSSSTENYDIFLGGSQFEEYKIEKGYDIHPSVYVFTLNKPKSFETFDTLGIVKRNPSTSNLYLDFENNNKLYYLSEVKEKTLTIEEELPPGVPTIREIKIIESSTPTIQSPMPYDIAIVPTLISFTNKIKDESLNNKPLQDSVVVFGKAPYDDENINNLIYYDSSEKKYKIKLDSEWKTIANNGKSIKNREMVMAMLFNEGKFSTWSKQTSRFEHRYGINSGGGRNFWSSNKRQTRY